MARAVDLPTARAYALDGTARLSARAPSLVLDRLLGRDGLAEGRPEVTATTTLPGGLGHLPSNVLDGDTSTWWTTTFAAPPDQTLRIEAPTHRGSPRSASSSSTTTSTPCRRRCASSPTAPRCSPRRWR